MDPSYFAGDGRKPELSLQVEDTSIYLSGARRKEFVDQG